jgi:hypothetical protein
LQLIDPHPVSATAQHSRSFWLKQLHQWHWISAALSLIGMLLFAITGFTLNHAGQIEAKPVVVSRKATLPADLLAAGQGSGRGQASPARPLEPWLDKAVGAEVAGREGEWSAEEVYVALARPGGDAWVSRSTARPAPSSTRRPRAARSACSTTCTRAATPARPGAGSSTSSPAACVIFTVTGLILLQFHARARPLTWPLVAAGLAAPVILVILFVHL